MTIEHDLAKLEAQVIGAVRVRGFLDSVAELRRLLVAESPDIRRKVLALTAPSIGRDLAAAVSAAFDIGVTDAVRAVGAGASLPTSSAPRELTAAALASQSSIRDLLGTARKLAQAGADPDAVLSPVFAAANALERDVVTLVNQAGNEGVAVASDLNERPTVWVAETNACVHCLAYSGRVTMPGKDFPGGLTYGSRGLDTGPLRTPPLHPNCLPGEIAVTPGSRVTGASARVYDGQMVRIKTLGDRELTGTPNHPVLTRRGWVGLGFIEPGDEVISRTGAERGIRRNDDDEYVPSLIGELAQATLGALEMAAREVPVSPVDFHGDGAGSEVGVVATDSLLLHELNGPLCEHHRELALVSARDRGISLTGDGASGQPLFRLDATAGGGMGRLAPSETLLRSGVRHAEGLGCLATATVDARFGERARDDRTADTEAGRDAELALARLVSGGDLVRVEDDTAGGRSPFATLARRAALDAGTLEGGEYPGRTDTEAIADILGALPGEIASDRVVNIERYAFHGMVYNLETECGWYIANGIVTHNCRCTLELLNDQSYADALRREADRSVLRGFSLESESMRVRVDAAERLLSRGVDAPKSVIAYARSAVKRGEFTTRDRP